MPFLAGKTAIVTGSTRGIGRAIAAALAREGASVAVCGRSEDAARAAAAELARETGAKVTGRACDVSRRDDVRALFDAAERELGPIDIVISNAGIGIFKPLAELSEDDWHAVIETNLTGVFHCCQEGVRRMRPRGGWLIQIGSLAGKNPFAGGSAYNASKFALNGFAEAMMLDHRHDNIRVSTIAPGSVATEFTAQAPPAPWKIAPEDIAEITLDILRLPARTLVSYVEVRPAVPPKK